MCIKLESKPSKKVVESNFDDDVLLYYAKVGEKDINVLYAKNDEFMYVLCPDGQVTPVQNPGFYKVFQKPVDVIWIKKVPIQFKIGVPKEATSNGIGFHAIISLHLIEALSILQSQELKTLKKSEISNLLATLARQVFESLNVSSETNIEELRKEFNKKLNELLLTANLSAFVAATSYIGLSTMCKMGEELEV